MINRARKLTAVALFIGTLLAMPGAKAESSEERVRYNPYSISATDRNNWLMEADGEIAFYDTSQTFKVFGEGATYRSEGQFYPQAYIKVKRNINNTLQDGPWYGICSLSSSVASRLDPIECKGHLDVHTTTCCSGGRTHLFYVGYDNEGVYFTFPTRPGRGLKGVWLRVCHVVDGPDTCGSRRYVDNPYIAGQAP